jgi:hypothetical protein
MDWKQRGRGGDELGTKRKERRRTRNRVEGMEMEWKQIETSRDGAGTEMKEWNGLGQREMSRDWTGNREKGAAVG